MKTKLLAILLLAGSSLFAGHVSIGIGLGGYVPAYGYYAPPPVAYVPACPGPGYSWVDGYWYPVGPRYIWRAGYWAPPAYGVRYRVAPRYYGRPYYGRPYRGYYGWR